MTGITPADPGTLGVAAVRELDSTDLAAHKVGAVEFTDDSHRAGPRRASR
ncbi:MAG: hypothetical protein ACRDTX_01585 [Pseudonocardiaceae bacterium]